MKLKNKPDLSDCLVSKSGKLKHRFRPDYEFTHLSSENISEASDKTWARIKEGKVLIKDGMCLHMNFYPKKKHRISQINIIVALIILSCILSVLLIM